MKSSIALFLICSLVLISGYSATAADKPAPTASPVEVPKPSTTTTHAPDPTTKSTTPTTTTTTTSSTTTSSNTEKPETTTSHTTTSAPPTPLPDAQPGTWNVSNENNVIIAHMAVQFSITYNVKDEKVQNKTVKMNIPTGNKTMTAGIFTPNLQAMKISWKSSGAENNSLSLVFKNTTKTYWLSRLEVTIQAEDLPGIDSKLSLYHEQGHFNTSIGSSYRCVKLQNFDLSRGNNTQIIDARVMITDLQFQAFKPGQDAHFGLAEDCAFDTPDIVPIAVGCVLAGLVVIILVGYLITRHRSQARGYLSM